ncbi:tyrosine-protein phosphatase [Micrococcoides hystricis]|uniref:Tyrosine-protein phosphatase n=1 Tax=Micrococcoides hystricis TaxID=1572761 RepID=A0ABV6PA17_9MICC
MITTIADQRRAAAQTRELALESLQELNIGLPVPASGDWDGGVNIWQVTPKLWRMGRNHWLTEQGWSNAFNAGVGLNVDLRTAVELPPRPHDPPAACRGAVKVLHLPIEEPELPAYQELCASEGIPYPNAPKYYPQLMTWFGPKITTVLNEIAQAGSGVVINCSAGRDRTGLISTLVMMLGGASDEEILGLHAASCAGINAWHRVSGRPHPYEYGRTGTEFSHWVNEHVGQLEQFVTALRSTDYVANLRATGLREENLRKLQVPDAGA